MTSDNSANVSIDTPMEIVLVAAVSANGVIGDDDGIPWDLPADQKRFREMTTGHPVIMGRKTYESIIDSNGHSLVNRDNIVLTTHHRRRVPIKDKDTDDGGRVFVATSIPTAIEQARGLENEGTAYVIGGEAVFRQFMDYADRIELTEIHEHFDGDTRFPEIGEGWEHTDWEQYTHEDLTYSFVTYERDSLTS